MKNDLFDEKSAEQAAPPKDKKMVADDSDKEKIQDLYDIYTAQGIKLASGVIENIHGQSDPRIISDAVLNIMNRVETEGEKNGIKFPLEVVAAAGRDILTAMLQMAKIQPDENMINQIVGLIVGKYLDERVKTGKISKEQLSQMVPQGDQQPQSMMPQDKNASMPMQQQMQRGGMTNG